MCSELNCILIHNLPPLDLSEMTCGVQGGSEDADIPSWFAIPPALNFRGYSAQEVMKQFNFSHAHAHEWYHGILPTFRLWKFTVIDKPIESKTIRNIYITLLMPPPIYFTQAPWYEHPREK